MRAVLSALSFLVAGIAVWAFFFRNPVPSPEDLVDMILAGNPEVTTDGVTLEGCYVVLSGERVDAATDRVLQAQLQADLRLYDLNGVRIVPTQDGAVTYVASHRAGLSAFTQEAARLAALLPANLRGEDVLTAPAIQDLLENSGGELSFRLTGLAVAENAETTLTPHPDAADFYHFAQDVLAQDPMLSARVTLTYIGQQQNEAGLLSGEVAMPGALQFRFASPKAAERFGRVFFAYQQAVCAD